MRNPVSKRLQQILVVQILATVAGILALTNLLVAGLTIPWALPGLVAILLMVAILAAMMRASARLARADLVPGTPQAHACRCVWCGERFEPTTPAMRPLHRGTPQERRLQGMYLVASGVVLAFAGAVTMLVRDRVAPVMPYVLGGVLLALALVCLLIGISQRRSASRPVAPHAHLCRWCGASGAQVAAEVTPVVAR